VLGDALGPRGRRRVAVASVVSAALIAVLVVVAVRRLVDAEQLTSAKWRPFTVWAIDRFLLLGLVATLKVAAISMALALVVGGFLALGRLARNAPTRLMAGSWVEVFRGVPLLLLIFFSARGLPKLGVDLPVFWYLVLGLVLYNSAVLAEIFRAGILSLDRGQTEAASALGLRYWSSMRLVILPQALRRMIPAIVSQLVTLLKDTSLGFVLPYEEFLRRGQLVGEVPGKPLLPSFLVVALVYILVNLVLSRIARRLEVRQRRRYRAGGIAVAGVEDLAVVAAHGDSRV
jgi:glutamate transport system permease protein